MYLKKTCVPIFTVNTVLQLCVCKKLACMTTEGPNLETFLFWSSRLSSSRQTANGPRHTKTFLWTYANSKGPDQPAHLHSLIRGLYCLHNQIIGYYTIFQWRTNAQMRLRMWSMMWSRTCACSKALFHLTWPKCTSQTAYMQKPIFCMIQLSHQKSQALALKIITVYFLMDGIMGIPSYAIHENWMSRLISALALAGHVFTCSLSQLLNLRCFHVKISQFQAKRCNQRCA